MAKLSKQQEALLIQEYIAELMFITERLNTKVPEAINVLTEALENNPNDFADTALKLLVQRKEVESNY